MASRSRACGCSQHTGMLGIVMWRWRWSSHASRGCLHYAPVGLCNIS